MLAETAGIVEGQLPGLFDLEKISIQYPTLYEDSSNTILTQELERYNKLLNRVKISLRDVQRALKGEVVMSTELETMGNSIVNGKVPGKQRETPIEGVLGMQQCPLMPTFPSLFFFLLVLFAFCTFDCSTFLYTFPFRFLCFTCTFFPCAFFACCTFSACCTTAPRQMGRLPQFETVGVLGGGFFGTNHLLPRLGGQWQTQHVLDQWFLFYAIVFDGDSSKLCPETKHCH